MHDARWLPLAPPHLVNMRVRLFCIPYAGGAARIFRLWQSRLPPTIGVYPLELPGHGTRLNETPVTRLAPLVQAVAGALQPNLDEPFAFFGYSMGALVAFELADYLRTMYRAQPAHLIVGAARAPHLPDRFSPLHALPTSALLDELRRLGGTPEVALDNQELMQLLLPALRADFAVSDTYRYVPRPALTCPILAFGGRDDRRVDRAELAAWQVHTTSSFADRLLPGGHFFVHSAESDLLASLAEQLSSTFD